MRVFTVPQTMLVERVADTTDLDFIYSCLLYGARKGHYSFDPENTVVVDGMKKEVRSVISQGLLADQRYAIASVFLLDNRRIGMLILCEAAPGESNYEIYVLSVAKRYQNQGYGSMILDNILNRLCHVNICARCSPASEVLKNMLLQRGFRPYASDNGFNTLVREAIESSDIAGTMHQGY